MHKPLRFQNKILALVPSGELSVIVPFLEGVDLPRGFLIAACDKRIEYVYFLEQGIGSIVSVSPEGQKAEAGMFGYEGFGPTPPAVGSDASFHEVIVQGAGYGYRLKVSDLGRLLETCRVFADLLRKSSHNLATQVSYTALTNAIHHVDERLARWLIMFHDRIRTDEFQITHDYMALMLAVRRSSVTSALHVLEGNLFIRAKRGLVMIRDRCALEDFAQDAYGRPEAEHRLFFGR